MGNKIESTDLGEIAKKVYSTNPKATVWDIFVEIFSRGDSREKYRIWILSELPVIEAVARGYSSVYIRGTLDIENRVFKKICKFWGLEPLDESVDFDPLEVYTDEMSIQDLKIKVAPIVIGIPEEDDLERCIHNIKIYKDIIEYLNELEEK